LEDYPESDIIQGKDYQTGYFVDGKHVLNRDSIEVALKEVKEEKEQIFAISSEVEEVNDSAIDIPEEEKSPTERVSDLELSSRITGIEHLSDFQFPTKRFCND